MKKIVVILMALVLACGVVFADTYTSSKGTSDSEYDPNKTVEFTMQTSKATPVVNVGSVKSTDFEGPYYITSFGQSTDAAQIETAVKKIGVKNYVYNATATASQIKSSNAKTLLIATGFSTKGLGAAGISTEEEHARCREIIEMAQKQGMKIVLVHIGGSARRTGNSEILIDLVLPYADYIILKEDANYDYKFTTYATEHNLPISLIFKTSGIVTVLTSFFGK